MGKPYLGPAGVADEDLATLGDVEPGPWHQVGEAGEPAFENGWQNLGPVIGTALPGLAFRRRGDVIDVGGYIYGGSMDPTPAAPTSPIIFTLPDGFVTAAQSNFLAVQSPDFASCTPVIVQAFPHEDPLDPYAGATDGKVAIVIPGVATGYNGPWGLGVVLNGFLSLDPPPLDGP